MNPKVVDPHVATLKQNIDMILQLSRIIAEKLKNVDTFLISDTDTLIQKAKLFLNEYTSIIRFKNVFSPRVIKHLGPVLVKLETLNDKFKSRLDRCNNTLELTTAPKLLIVSFSKLVSDTKKDLDELIKEIDFFYLMNDSLSKRPIEAVNRIVYNVEITDISKDSEVALRFQQYFEIALNTDLNVPLFKTLAEEILDLIKNVYNKPIDTKVPEISSFATIIGPSLMGKTQFAFSLARVFPVIYLNFLASDSIPPIYKAFENFSAHFKEILANDIKLLLENQKNKTLYLGLENILSAGSRIKFGTIGFLWKLVKESTELDSIDSDWFKHYINPRKISHETLTFTEYLENLDSLLKNLTLEGKTFKPPVVFIDEYDFIFGKEVAFLKDLCRILALPCVIASRNCGANLVGISYGREHQSDPREDEIYVYTIRNLPKADMNAIFKLLDLDKYSVNGNQFNTSQLLLDLRLTYDEDNLNQLGNLISLAIDQSKTCLQGIPLIIFRALKEKLMEHVTNNLELNTRAVWEFMMASLRAKLEIENEDFFDFGSFHSLTMMSKWNVFGTNSGKGIGQPYYPVMVSDFVPSTIDSHYYYFGTEEDPNIMPFGFDGKCLYYKNDKYSSRSHFTFFKDDLFLCMALWGHISSNDDDYTKVASSIFRYKHKIKIWVATAVRWVDDYVEENRIRRCDDPNNNELAQKCMIIWSLCNSTHSTSSGRDFLLNFVRNIQIDEETFSSIYGYRYEKLESLFTHSELDISTCGKLQTFLADINVPYLLPKGLVDIAIESKLNGLCHLGSMLSLKNNQIEFDLFYKNTPGIGNINFTFMDRCLSVSDLLKHVKISQSYPISFLIFRSLDDNFPKTKNHLKKELPKEVDQISIYSVFRAEKKLKIVALAEFDKPKSVLIIIQTNFHFPWN